MRDYIERLRAKPEHVRRRIALGATFGITGVVAAVWFFGLIFSGSLSLGIPSNTSGNTGTLAQANSTDVQANTADGSDSNDSNVAGAAAANPFPNVPATQPAKSNFSSLLAAMGINTAPKPAPTLQVEDAAPSTTNAANSSGPTVIPF